MAKAVPDSRTPRRFSTTMIATMTTVLATLWSAIQENIGVEARLSTPAEVDTATVST